MKKIKSPTSFNSHRKNITINQINPIIKEEILTDKMDAFEITGGNKLNGNVTPQGAKNEALQVICAVLLTNEEITIRNIPNIKDVNILIKLLKFFLEEK